MTYLPPKHKYRDDTPKNCGIDYLVNNEIKKQDFTERMMPKPIRFEFLPKGLLGYTDLIGGPAFVNKHYDHNRKEITNTICHEVGHGRNEYDTTHIINDRCNLPKRDDLLSLFAKGQDVNNRQYSCCVQYKHQDKPY